MRLRTALKIRKTIGTARETVYTKRQVCIALKRYERTQSAKDAQEFWNALMLTLGAEGRAKLVMKWDMAGAFALLMDTPENQWKGKPGLMVKEHHL